MPVEFIQTGSGDAGGDDSDDIIPPIQNLVVTTKAYQALDAIQSVLPRMTTGANDSSAIEFDRNSAAPRIILLCNGALAVKDELQRYLDRQFDDDDDANIIPQLVLATTTHGAYRENTSQSAKSRQSSSYSLSFVHAGYGKTFVADSAKDVGNLWGDAGLNCSLLSSDTMNSLLWKKLAVNCVINPLTAIYQCTNGELLREPSFFELQHDILSEVAQVMAACATVADKVTTDIDERKWGESTQTIASTDEFRQFVLQVIQDTQDNRSSMYQDIATGQRTEIDHLNGYIVQQGRRMNLDCPTNEDICQRILDLQLRSY